MKSKKFDILQRGDVDFISTDKCNNIGEKINNRYYVCALSTNGTDTCQVSK